jgi:hypothetical protein
MEKAKAISAIIAAGASQRRQVGVCFSGEEFMVMMCHTPSLERKQW